MNTLDHPYTCYLSGPISGLSYEGATGWREHATAVLTEAGIHVLSPMRGKRSLSHQGMMKPGGYRRPAFSDAALKARDLADVRRSDVILVNFEAANEKSLGTTFELGWSDILGGKFVVIVMSEDNCHSHGFVRESADVIVKTLDEALDCIVEWAGVV